MMLRLNAAGTPYQIVLTKTDLCTPTEKKTALAGVFQQIMSARMCSALPYVYCVSTVSGEGIDVMKRSIAEVTSFNWQGAQMQEDGIMELSELDASRDITVDGTLDDDEDMEEYDEEEEELEEIEDEVENDLASGVKREKIDLTGAEETAARALSQQQHRALQALRANQEEEDRYRLARENKGAKKK